MNDGHFFEIAPSDSSVVWEYINPVTRDGIKKIKKDNYPTYNAAFRAYRYTKTHPALVGHDLTPGKPITGFDPDYITTGTVTSATRENEYLTPETVLSQNYPNPFTYDTTIEFDLENNKQVNIVIYSFSGNIVKSLYNENCTPGKYRLNWDGTNENGITVESGMNYYVLTADNEKISKKMIYYK